MFQIDSAKIETKAQVVEYILAKYFNKPLASYTDDEVVKWIDENYKIKVSRTLVNHAKIKLYGKENVMQCQCDFTEKNSKVWFKIVLVALAAAIAGVVIAWAAFNIDLSLFSNNVIGG